MSLYDYYKEHEGDFTVSNGLHVVHYKQKPIDWSVHDNIIAICGLL